MAFSTKLLLATQLMTCFLFREILSKQLNRPNLLMIVVDDLGWNDIGAHDPNMVTPTIDSLYNTGFRLNHTYADPSGSASRASLLSGKFSFRMGLQDGAINKYSGAHVPLNHTLLPMALKFKGYKTHFVGTWGQGFCRLDQTPTYRGFDTFFGHYTSSVNYTTKKNEGFYDFRDGEEVMRDPTFKNVYNTDVLGKRAIKVINSHNRKFPDNRRPFFLMLSFNAIQGPNQVPYKYLRKCRDSVFSTDERRQKCGMMAAVDINMFKILRALKNTKLDHKTLIFFTADGGGDVALGSSNWPLRGSKGSVWEGGIRVPSFIWSPSPKLLPVQDHTYTGYFHTVDWYPTLIGFALKRGRPSWPQRIAPPMDGKNHWRLIKRGVRKSFRSEWAYMVNEGGQNLTYVRQGDFKMIINENEKPGWYNPPFGFNATSLEVPTLNWDRKPFLLFNVRRDPSETRDLSTSKVDKIVNAREGIMDLYNDYKYEYVSKVTSVVDSSPASHPDHNEVWSHGSC